jgi:hypothetical protein
MCYTCGCKLPYEDHGDPANIVEAHLEAAGATETIGNAGVATAKENLLELIRLQQDGGELDHPKQRY